MNRFVLISEAIENIRRDLLRSEIYPHRELTPIHRNYWIGFFANLFFKAYLGAEYINTHNIPETGPAVLAANHSSHLDGMLINTASLHARRRSVAFLAAADVYNSNRIFQIMCDIVKCIPVKRHESDRAALLKTIRLLRQGELVGIFPEGKRSRDGSMGRGKEGVAAIALATGFPVIPVGISGTFEAFPREAKVIKPTKVKLKFGTPLRFDKEKHSPPERISWVRDQIMDEIKRLYKDLVNGREEKQRLAA
jgi:1-acyl-sn-glycerol-3-phosphate acyltransferase